MAVSELLHGLGQNEPNPFIDFLCEKVTSALNDSSDIQLECVANQVQILGALGTIPKDVAKELLDIIGKT